MSTSTPMDAEMIYKSTLYFNVRSSIMLEVKQKVYESNKKEINYLIT